MSLGVSLGVSLAVSLASLAPSPAAAQGVFLRGDCDQSRAQDISDSIYLLSWLFLGGDEPECFDACDLDDGESVDITDAIYGLSWLFLGGSPPRPPFPFEGLDPSGDALDCRNGRTPLVDLRIVPSRIVLRRTGQSVEIELRGVSADGEEQVVAAAQASRLEVADGTVAVLEGGHLLTASAPGTTRVVATVQGVDAEAEVLVLPSAAGGPRISLDEPPPGAVLAGSVVRVAGHSSDAAAGIRVTVAGRAATSVERDAGRFHAVVPADSGPARIVVEAEGAGGTSRLVRDVTVVDAEGPGAIGPDGRPLPSLPAARIDSPDTTAPRIRITSPSAGSTLDSARVQVKGTVDDAEADVRVNGVPAVVLAGAFLVDGLRLAPGPQRLEAVATDRLGNVGTDRVDVTVAPPFVRLTIDEPSGDDRLLVASGRRARVAGTVDPASSRVWAGGVAATVSGGRWTALLDLAPGWHDLVVVASPSSRPDARASLVRALLVDVDPPHLEILAPIPPEGSGAIPSTTATTVEIVGRVHDDGEDARDGEPIRVGITGGPEVSTARGFALTAALAVGENEVEVWAEDGRGRRTLRALRVRREPGPGPTLLVVGGDAQTVLAGSALPQPLRVRAVDALGLPRRGVSVRARVAAGSGVLDGAERIVARTTGSGGEAEWTFAAGREAGAASQVVIVSIDGEPGTIRSFRVDTIAGPPAALLPRDGVEAVSAATGEDPVPWRVVLVDAGGRPVPGRPVTFRRVSGGALPAGQESVTVTTDGQGTAEVEVSLPPAEAEHEIEAAAAGVEPLRLRVLGRLRSDARLTSIEGRVEDDAGRPLAGATVEVAGVDGALRVTDGGGWFRLDGVPSGELLLLAHGAAEFGSTGLRTRAIAGRANQVGDPIVVSRLASPDRARTVRLDGTSGVLLALASRPGLRLELPAGGVAFPDGGAEGLLTATGPNLRALRAPLPVFVAPRVALRILPEGARFTSGVRLSLPAHGHPPGAVLPLWRALPGAGGYALSGYGSVTEDGHDVELRTPLRQAGTVFFALPEADAGRLEGAVHAPILGATEVGQREKSAVVGEGVYAHSGELVVDEVDLELRGRGLSYRFRRRYESRHLLRGSLGPGWEHEYADRRLLPGAVSGNVVRADGAGRFDEYLYDRQSGAWASPLGVHSKLWREADGTLVERSPDGTRHLYHPLDGSLLSGRLASIIDASGNRLDMEHDERGLLTLVSDPLGRDTAYAWNDDGTIRSITDPTGRVVRFGHDERGDLVSVTGPAVVGTPHHNDYPDGKTTEYVYSSGHDDRRLDHNLVAIVDPREVRSGSRRPRLQVTYGEDPGTPEFDRVIAQDIGGVNDTGIAAGGRVLFTYRITPYGETAGAIGPEEEVRREAGRTEVVLAGGDRLEVVWSAAGLPLSERRFTREDARPRDPSRLHPPPGVLPPWYETRYEWTAEGLLAAVVHPRGNRVEYVRDGDSPLRYARADIVEERRIPVPGGDAGTEPVLVVRRTYDPLFRVVVRETPPLPEGVDDHDVATRRRLDYQEGVPLETLAAAAGVAAEDLAAALERSSLELGLGDLNDDGVTGVAQGHVVLEELPDATLPDGTRQEARRTFVRNRFGQLTGRRDARGALTRWRYHPESDPDGDGTPDAGEGRDPTTGGYLASRVVDVDGVGAEAPLTIETRYEWDERGHLARRIDPGGQETLFTHNELGQLVEERWPAPLRYRRWYDRDEDDNLVRIRVEHFRATESNHHGLVIGDPWIVVEWERDILGRVVTRRREVSEEEGEARTIVERYRYDAQGHPARRISAVAGADEAWEHDERGLVIAHEKGAGTPAASRREWHHDENGNVVLEVAADDADGDGERERWEWRYDGHDRLAARIDPAGAALILERDPAGRVVSEALLEGAAGDPGTDPVRLVDRTTRELDERGREVRVRRELFGDGRGSRALVDETWHDAEGLVVRRRDASGGELVIERDAAGRETARVEPSGVVETREYDVAGWLVRETRTEAATDVGAPPPGEDPDFDEQGRLLHVESWVHVHDGLGRRVASIGPDGSTWRARYDSLHRVILVTDPTGPVITVGADPGLAAVADLLTPEQAEGVNQHGNRVHRVHDALGRLVEVRHELRRDGTGGSTIDLSNPFDVDGVITESFEWDDESRLVAWTDDRGARTVVEYDEASIPVRKTWPDGTSEVRESGRDGLPDRVTRSDGTVIRQRYDALGRLVVRWVEADGAGEPAREGSREQRFGWDARSRPVTWLDGNDPETPEDDTIVRRRHDSCGRVIAEERDGFELRVEHDALDRPVSVEYPDGGRFRIVRGAHGRATAIEGERGTHAVYRRFDSGRLLERTVAGGVRLAYTEPDGEGHSRLTGYDRTGRVVRQEHVGSDGETVCGFEYGRNRRGLPLWERRLHEISAPGDVWRYDSVYRIARYYPDVLDPRVPPADPLRKLVFTRDGNHNWRFVEVDQSTRSVGVGARSQLTTLGRDVLRYDGTGALVGIGDREYRYDAFGRLVRVLDEGQTVARYTYDAVGAEDPFAFSGRGRRARRDVVRPAAGQAAGRRELFYLGSRLAEVRDAKGAALRAYVWADGSAPELLVHSAAGGWPEVLAFLDDGRGSVAGLVDPEGRLVERVRYGPFGTPTILSPEGNPFMASRRGNEVLFGGLEWDAETGLIARGGRRFAPTLGRWLDDASPWLPAESPELNGYLRPDLPGMPGHGGDLDPARFGAPRPASGEDPGRGASFPSSREGIAPRVATPDGGEHPVLPEVSDPEVSDPEVSDPEVSDPAEGGVP